MLLVVGVIASAFLAAPASAASPLGTYKIGAIVTLIKGAQRQVLPLPATMRVTSRTSATVLVKGKALGRITFRPPLSLTARSQAIHGNVNSPALGVAGPVSGSLTRSGAHYTFRATGSGTIKSGQLKGVKWSLKVAGTK
jgi:hypothetical protein